MRQWCSRHSTALCTYLLTLTFELSTFTPAIAQVSAECRASECTDGSRADTAPSRRLWLGAASIHQLKLEFVDALQEFTRAQAGTFGDEGAALVRSVASMGESLQRWDRAIEQFQVEARRLVPSAESELAVATVLLDRYRIEDGLARAQSSGEPGRQPRGYLHASGARLRGVGSPQRGCTRAAAGIGTVS